MKRLTLLAALLIPAPALADTEADLAELAALRVQVQSLQLQVAYLQGKLDEREAAQPVIKYVPVKDVSPVLPVVVQASACATQGASACGQASGGLFPRLNAAGQGTGPLRRLAGLFKGKCGR